jgi:hypothetical protein
MKTEDSAMASNLPFSCKQLAAEMLHAAQVRRYRDALEWRTLDLVKPTSFSSLQLSFSLLSFSLSSLP